MNRLPVLAGLFALCCALLVGSGYGQDKKDDTKKDMQPTKVKLPTNWSKLGIVGDQKKKIYTVLGDYQGKIASLKEQIDKLQKEEYVEAYKLLNDDQKAQLKKILEKGVDSGKDDKKTDDKKIEDKKDKSQR